MTMLCLINQLCNENCQFVIATHSPIVLSYPNATIHQISESTISEVDYEDSDLFITTKNFLNNPQKYLHYLLNECT